MMAIYKHFINFWQIFERKLEFVIRDYLSTNNSLFRSGLIKSNNIPHIYFKLWCQPTKSLLQKEPEITWNKTIAFIRTKPLKDLALTLLWNVTN